MAAVERSTWPLTLFLGLCISLLLGGAVAIAEPSEDGRLSWQDDEPERVTGTVIRVDEAERSIVLDGLVAYTPERAEAIGTLNIEVDDPAALAVDETVDVVLDRHDGRWRAEEIIVLDTD